VPYPQNTPSQTPERDAPGLEANTDGMREKRGKRKKNRSEVVVYSFSRRVEDGKLAGEGEVGSDGDQPGRR